MGSCSAMQGTSPKNNDSAPAFSSVSFTKDPAYVAIEQFGRKYSELEAGISGYDRVRRAGRGTFKDFDELFQYLLGKGLTDSDAVSKSHYYQHAVSTAVGSPVPFTN